ncbi:BRE1 E3 ubiquitin ligase-domain-containing protein [Limtongia smithiae]|uniref:BRE1 E3 ubiquitin ligase-domain-containing protein n=1 Tax=Limtongia smithiae TaxID=1125753 RepID=UPI0034D01FD4
MDDRKRALPIKTDPDAPPLKRQATEYASPSTPQNGTASSGVPLNQEDVYLFQKEAIFRQMQVYRRERDLLQHRVTQLEQQTAYHDDHLRLLELWWDGLVKQVEILGGRPPSASTANGETKAIPKISLALSPDQYGEHLATKRASILESLKSLFKSITSGSIPEEAKLQESLAGLTTEVASLKADNERLQDEREDLERRLTDATFKFMSAEKKLDRMKSSTLAKIERSSVSSPAVQRENSVDEKAEQEKKAEADDALIARVQKESAAIVQKQSQELTTLQTKVLTLQDEISKLNFKFSSLSESDIVASEPYKILKIRYDELTTRSGHLEALNETIKQENEKLSGERTEYKETIAAEYQAIADDVESHKKKLELDLTRIRAARDDLATELTIRRAKEDSRASTLVELTALAEMRASRIKSLELEVDRWKTQCEPQLDNGAVAPTPSPDDSAEELLKRIEKLEKQNQFLSAELPGMETAFNQAHALSTKKVADLVERDEKLMRLAGEKAKADQKYFSAMRAKDATATENKLLKAQSVKSGEIIQQLRDAEKSVSQKVIILEKQIAELENMRHTYQVQLQEVQRKCSEQAVSLESYRLQVEKLFAEMQTRASAIASEAEARRQAEEQLERTKVELERWRSEKRGGFGSVAEGGGGSLGGNGTGASSSSLRGSNGVDASQIEGLRAIAICSVCSKNWKDTVIKTCGHCFCNQCANDRLNARLRKCPVCNKQYSYTDLMAVHL